jgi:Domain of unknown function (DUF4263)
MASVLETIVFEPARFLQELQAFDDLLKSKADLSEREDIQPFFKKSKHLTAYLGTFASSIGVATEICFEYEFFGDFKADILVGSKQENEFCVVEFEDGKQDTIFKKQKKRKNPEWSARFERVQPVRLQTSHDRKSLDYRKKRHVRTDERRQTALSMGHYWRRPGAM